MQPYGMDEFLKFAKFPGLGEAVNAALGPIGWALTATQLISSVIGSSQQEEERRKREALQRAQMLSRSFEQAGGRWGY